MPGARAGSPNLGYVVPPWCSTHNEIPVRFSSANRVPYGKTTILPNLDCCRFFGLAAEARAISSREKSRLPIRTLPVASTDNGLQGARIGRRASACANRQPCANVAGCIGPEPRRLRAAGRGQKGGNGGASSSPVTFHLPCMPVKFFINLAYVISNFSTRRRGGRSSAPQGVRSSAKCGPSGFTPGRDSSSTQSRRTGRAPRRPLPCRRTDRSSL